MKTKKINSKLLFNKSTVANLDFAAMVDVKGGANPGELTYTCDQNCGYDKTRYNCPLTSICTVPRPVCETSLNC